MTTRDQWQAMTEQQQWDYLRLLEDTVDTLELDGDGEVDIPQQFTETQVRKILAPYMYERSIKAMPTDEQHS